MKRNTRRIVSFALSLTACANMLLANPSGRLLTGAVLTAYAKEAAETAEFGISRNYLKAGDYLKVNNPNSLALRYYQCDPLADHTDPSNWTQLKASKKGLQLTEDLYEKWIIVEADDGEKTMSDAVYFSKLPVVYIDSRGVELPHLIEEKSKKVACNMFIQSNEETKKALYDGKMTLSGRGNTTWSWDKKPYKIKLDSKTNLFGFGKSKKYVLLANYLDESLLRNTTAAHLSEELGLTTMQTTWVDVIINGEYAGNYQLGEQVGAESARVDILDWEDVCEDAADALAEAIAAESEYLYDDLVDDLETAMTEDMSWLTTDSFTYKGTTYKVSDYYKNEYGIDGGYLFESSQEFDEASQFVTKNNLKIMMKTPEFLATTGDTNPDTEDMWSYVQTLWQDFEDAYRAENGYNGKGQHYTEIADLDSMVSYWLLQEILGNNDARYKSRYIYKQHNGKLTFGPPWDFDTGLGSSLVTEPWGLTAEGEGWATGWKVSNFDHLVDSDFTYDPLISEEENELNRIRANQTGQNFYTEFLDDPLFCVKATEKYWQIRPYLESLIEEGGLLDQDSAYVRESGLVDEQRWVRSEGESNEEWNQYARGYEEDTRLFKAYLRERIAWLDEQFEGISTLSDSRINIPSAAPYQRTGQTTFKFLSDTNKDCSEHIPSYCAVPNNTDVKLAISEDGVEGYDVYVNGLKLMTNASCTDGITIPSDMLYNADGVLNVVSVVGYNALQQPVSKDFCTFVQTDAFFDAVNHVIDLIGTIGEVAFTENCAALITEAREAYNALSDGQKAHVTNYNELQQAETTYAALKQAAADEEAANAIILTRHENKAVISGGKNKVYAGFTANIPEGYTVEDYGLIYYNSGNAVATSDLTLDNVNTNGILKAKYWCAKITDKGFGVLCVGYVTVKNDDGCQTTLYTEELGNSYRAMKEIAKKVTFTRQDNKAVISGGKKKVFVGFSANVPEGCTVEDYGLIYYNSGTVITTPYLTLENVDVCGIKKAKYWSANITDIGYGVACVGFVKVKDQNGYVTVLYTEELGGSFAAASEAAAANAVTLTRRENKAVESNGRNKVFVGFNANLQAGYTVEDYGLIYYNSGNVIHTEHLILSNVKVCGIQSAKYWAANITDNGFGVVCVGFVNVKDANGYVTTLYTEELGAKYSDLVAE